MDSFRSQTRKKRLTPNQLMLLETNFNFDSKLDPGRKSQLALQLGVPPRQVATWYQNRRARDKNQSLEIDHKILQLRLENILSHNAKLQEEVARLKDKLNKVQEMLQTFNSSFSSSSDEVGSTNLIHSSKNHLDMEPYASFIRDAGQFGPTEGDDLFA
ncbi:homeobox-leucine zipper ATHB-52-like [Olea europaea subsp. europaea]|uniref:Homeobox-leucine zipper protein n=1 Tax=Olea europaea subsp. europaea TaxID=158383 RepID=A0A8S0UFU4_OLEEU|nr:homeobox-leucine zipper ATHB-52-like [Olea europaea subsp. europaea]